MLDRAKAVLCAVLCSFGVSTYAATVTFLIFESGLREDAPNAEASLIWESKMMDVFFESGHIVSNAGLSRLEKPGLPPVGTGLKEALDGGADLYVQVTLGYRSSDKALRLSPEVVSCRACDTKGKTLYQIENKVLSPALKEADEVANARDFARALVGGLKGRMR